MKLLFDQNISFRVVSQIKIFFPEAFHVRDFNLQFASDKQIWDFAKENQYNVVTLDADFYDLVILFGHPPKIIWLRLGNTSSNKMAAVIINQKELILNFLEHMQYSDISCLEIYG